MDQVLFGTLIIYNQSAKSASLIPIFCYVISFLKFLLCINMDFNIFLIICSMLRYTGCRYRYVFSSSYYRTPTCTWMYDRPMVQLQYNKYRVVFLTGSVWRNPKP